MKEEEKNISIDDNKEEEKVKTPIEKYLFFTGFIFPILWFIGSTTKGYSFAAYEWKKRCRIAATLILVLGIVMVATVMVVKPTLFGLKSDIGAQTSAASNNAIRPGVPIIGTNGFGDTVAGIGVDSNN